MTVKDLINKLEKYNPDLPICLNDNIDFIEMNEETIKVEKHKYACFPFTDNDEFEYISLRGDLY
jgi:hypothetical protein